MSRAKPHCELLEKSFDHEPGQRMQRSLTEASDDDALALNANYAMENVLTGLLRVVNLYTVHQIIWKVEFKKQWKINLLQLIPVFSLKSFGM